MTPELLAVFSLYHHSSGSGTPIEVLVVAVVFVAFVAIVAGAAALSRRREDRRLAGGDDRAADRSVST